MRESRAFLNANAKGPGKRETGDAEDMIYGTEKDSWGDPGSRQTDWPAVWVCVAGVLPLLKRRD